MILTPPLFEDEFSLLAPLWPVIWEAAEYGCDKTSAFPEFVAAQLVDRALAPDLWRYHARGRLHERGIQNAEFIPHDVARNGLAFSFQGRHFRVWKKGRERVPRAGKSQAKVLFLGQQGFLGMEFASTSYTVMPNRVILYETDTAFHLKHLWYAVTLQGATDAPTTVHWVHRVTFDMIERFGLPPVIIDPALANEADDLPLRPAAEVEGDQIGEEDAGEEGAEGVGA